MTYFHVSSVLNRESIQKHGLDSSRMGAARSIAGPRYAEVDGVFLSRDEFEVEFFIMINATGGPIDVWAVEPAASDQWVETNAGFRYVVGTVAAERITLIRRDIPGSAR